MLSSIFAATFAFGASLLGVRYCLISTCLTLANGSVAQSSSVVCVAGQCLQGYSNTTLGATLSASGISTEVLLLPGQYTTGSSVALPLNIALQPGMTIYPQAFYSGQGSYSNLPTSPVGNATIPFTASSFALSGNVWAAVSAGSNSRVVLWNSVPDCQSAACKRLRFPICCSTYNHHPVRRLVPGMAFAPLLGRVNVKVDSLVHLASRAHLVSSDRSARPARQGCQTCHRAVTASMANVVPTGQCTCLAGWTSASNGTQCAACAAGFFWIRTGTVESESRYHFLPPQSHFWFKFVNWAVNSVRWHRDCITCASGFTQDGNDRTKCDAIPQTTSNGTACPDGSYGAGSACAVCSPLARLVLGRIRTIATGGVCSGSNMIANNNKHECDMHDLAKYQFQWASTANQAQCTGCLPGFVLSQGQCVTSCPCAGSATTCLTCANNLLASNGQCVNSCPSNTFSSSGACISCHPDCATCSGASFNHTPVLTSGRCLATCSQNQYFDTTSSTCQSAIPVVLAVRAPVQIAASLAHVLVKSCVGVLALQLNCTSGTSVVPSLGACLSELVLVSPSGTSSGAILLMALGCAFILWLLYCGRRRARKQRAKATAAFASAKALHKQNWRWRLARFGERLFGHNRSPRPESEEIALWKLRHAEEARHHNEMEKLMIAQGYSRSGSSRSPSPLPSLHPYERRGSHDANRLSANSMYSQLTGEVRSAPEPRQPVKSDPLSSRFSTTTLGSSAPKKPNVLKRQPTPKAPSNAEQYAASVRQSPAFDSTDWITPTNTGGSRNPFRK
ncbi:growth factor receptor domain-containing protein [Suillus cothurnatus]|nr:growth factor receptor domain-containing protein [Suillus cothurnatus]